MLNEGIHQANMCFSNLTLDLDLLDLVRYFTGTLVINVGHKREGGDLEHN